ncbi:hypothetical protein EW026_g5054 [Hermanssonia centrifuga]|uniref:(4-O-methyl)-D-glucuronate--lignin esterase n=1 Tax=Hermanssonia centrifuga TaxID=98765 RepID=A0A4S4KFC3_9APHY|nr:hypothetical protein EW026_g5054 [Hermanssonia centrifuga]
MFGRAVSRFRDEIWSYIDQANQKAPTFARIFREMVLICDPAKPLPRAAKGNVVRKHALELYAHAIEHLYDRSEISQGSTLSSPTSWTVEDIETWLLALTASVNNGQPLLAAVDIFEQGLDSLHVTFIRNHIISALRLSRNLTSVVISQNFIYDHPTIHNLAAAIFEIVNPKSDSQETKETRQADQINELIKKYSRDLPKANTKVTPPADKVVVLLTGPTGSLGSHLLADLLEDDRVSKVYALSRPSPQSIERQRTSFLDRGLPTHLLSHNKYAPISGDFNWNNFGLEQAIFKEIQGSVSHIIHNAWKVDFNHGLSSFESQITGTRKLVDFCFNLDRPVRLLFMSSIGVAQGWDNQSGPIPETPLSDPGLATDSGYSASKYVVEQVLSQAHTNGLEATSLRIGQVCGSRSTGAWNITDWVPILVKSSMAMGKLPVIDEPVTWLPVDVVARATVDLLFSKSELPTLVNMIHPRPVAWEDIINAINQSIGTTLSVVSLDEWVDALELLSSSATPQDLTNIPAVKLIEFFRSLKESSERNSSTGEPGSHNTFETSKLVTFSQTMRELPSISQFVYGEHLNLSGHITRVNAIQRCSVLDMHYVLHSVTEVVYNINWSNPGAYSGVTTGHLSGYEAGTLPGPPQTLTSTFTQSGTTGTLAITAANDGPSITFSQTVTFPSGTAPAGGWPLLIAFEGGSIPVPSGIAVLSYSNSNMAQQNDATSRGLGLFYNLYGSNATASAMTAWVWGVSRIIDVLETTPAANINTQKIAVTGCSRDGKGALMAGAFEPRIALTIPQESGSGGDTCWRLSLYEQNSGSDVQTATEIVGENVWFSTNFANYVNDLSSLPFDHHLLAAMIAPRPLISYENTDVVLAQPSE